MHGKYFLTLLFAVISLALSMLSQAALVDRGNGLIYDSDRNITWWHDANYAVSQGDIDGRVNWGTAMAMANSATIGGFTEWRLPTVNTVDPSCDETFSWNSVPANRGFNCTGSDMGHLFYTELGVTAFNHINTSTSTALNLFSNPLSSTEKFADAYWLNIPFFDTSDAWRFWTKDGKTSRMSQHSGHNVILVHEGDIGAVPLPASAWLLGSGLLGIIATARRRRTA